jgi:RimJ/RimL family protein N-acetyltransferase
MSDNFSRFMTGKVSYFRSLVEDDWELIANWINNPNFNKFLFQGWKSVTPDDVKKQFTDERISENAIQFAQCDVDSNNLVGWCGFYRWDKISHSAELRTFVSPDKWGCGLGTEQYALLVKLGFDRFNLNRLYFGTHEKNIGTLKIYEKLHFVKEGISRQDVYRNGLYSNNLRFSILKDEYLAETKDIIDSFLN